MILTADEASDTQHHPPLRLSYPWELCIFAEARNPFLYAGEPSLDKNHPSWLPILCKLSLSPVALVSRRITLIRANRNDESPSQGARKDCAPRGRHCVARGQRSELALEHVTPTRPNCSSRHTLRLPASNHTSVHQQRGATNIKDFGSPANRNVPGEWHASSQPWESHWPLYRPAGTPYKGERRI